MTSALSSLNQLCTLAGILGAGRAESSLRWLGYSRRFWLRSVGGGRKGKPAAPPCTAAVSQTVAHHASLRRRSTPNDNNNNKGDRSLGRIGASGTYRFVFVVVRERADLLNTVLRRCRPVSFTAAWCRQSDHCQLRERLQHNISSGRRQYQSGRQQIGPRTKDVKRQEHSQIPCFTKQPALRLQLERPVTRALGRIWTQA